MTEVVQLNVFDDTYEAALSLWGCMARSAAHWKASHTILLLSSPGLRCGTTSTLNIGSDTLLDVDPEMSDATWLRHYTLKKENPVNESFPEEGMPYNFCFTVDS